MTQHPHPPTQTTMACALSRRVRQTDIWVELKDNSSLDRGSALHTVFPNPGVFKLQPHKRLVLSSSPQ